MRYFKHLLLLAVLLFPCVAQESSNRVGGFLTQTAATPQSYLIENSQQLESFVTMLPKVTPFKTLPASPNPDPFLEGYSPNFEEKVLIVVTGRDRITDPPVFLGVETSEDGIRRVRFELPERTTKTYPYGWAVYTGVVLPRIEGNTKVLVNGVEEADEDFQRGNFKRAEFQKL